MKRLFANLLLTIALFQSQFAIGHESMPASLLIQQQQMKLFDIQWREPRTQGIVFDINPVFPDDCKAVSSKTNQKDGNTELYRWKIYCEQGLVASDSIIHFTGLPMVMFDAVVTVNYINGDQTTAIARPGDPSVSLATKTGETPSVSAYLKLGIEHILSGSDHLLFVFCLILLSDSIASLLKTVTAFTLAHSVTLSLSSLKIISLPSPPVEFLIALSIVYLAREILLINSDKSRKKIGLWGMAFVFGLLHGLGFAGVLKEIGLPHDAIFSALFLFNVGVELGQLSFIAVVYPVLRIIRRVYPAPQIWASQLPVYVVGGMASFWIISRLLLVLAG